jgi:hypothetical protein
MATTSSQKYASSDFITSITDTENTAQAKLNSASGQVLTTANFNNVFTPINVAGVDTATLIQMNTDFEKTYQYGAIDITPYSSLAAKNAPLGCKTVPEYATSSNINMSIADGGAYHTFNTCSNKASMLNKKYFSIVKPLPSAGINDPNVFQCLVGDEPLIKSGNDTGSTSYYDYVVCWTMGPTVKTFGISSDTGDIIITADNIANMGVKQNMYSDKVANYTYGNAGTFLPPNTFVSLKTYIFDLNQVTVTGGYMNGGYIGRDIPISKVALVPGTNDTFIVGVNDGAYTKMVKIQVAIGNSKLYPSLPNDGSLYAKAIEARYSGLHRFVRITASCNNDNWLQISELQVFDENGVNVAQGRPAFGRDAWAWFTRPTNATSGNAAIKPYWAGFHSGSPCNSWWIVDLGRDVNITKIVYYNRQDCCQGRINGALLDGLGVNGEILYRAVMNGDMVQTYQVQATTSDLNSLWNKGIQTNIVGNDSTPGYGVKGLNVRVDPVALGRGNPGYASQKDSQLPAGQTSYKTLTGVDANVCQSTCDNDPNCLGYTTYGTTTAPVEVAPIDLGCYIDAPERAMTTWIQGGSYNKDTCLIEAQKRGHNMFGLQFYGNCFTTNDESPQTGYARYGKENRQPCLTQGSWWQNHVYKRNFETRTVSNCNFYGDNIASGTQPAPGSNTAVRSKTSAPVNNTTLNFTNNALKLDLTQCASNACKFRLELGTDGNLKLYKLASANGTTSSSSTGEVVWDLFASDDTVATKVKAIAPITQLDWKNAFNNGTNNILAAGESLPSTKKQLISPNGQFKLEIAGGYLQLKAAVYGCFSTDTTYKNTSAPMYTNAVQSGPQPYYVYQSDLSHPKVGNVYYGVSGPKGVAIKTVDRTNPLLLNGNTYLKLPDKYMPFLDTDPNIVSTTNAAECQAKCSASPNCKYMYMKNDNQCLLGNKTQPAYVAQPSDSKDNYALYLRNQSIDTTNVGSTVSLSTNVGHSGPDFYKRNLPINFYGPPVTGAQDIGGLATPIGQAILARRKEIQGPDVPVQSTTPAPPPTAPTYPGSNYASPPKSADNTAKPSASSYIEGFDTHEWSDPGQDCGQGTNPACYQGIKYGQVLPLQSIAQDYSNQLNKMNSIYSDMSGNIGKYNTLYNTMMNDAKYDFSGNQPIVLNGNTNLLTEMNNDSKRLALQTNNMYIAGSILSTTLLVSAIYLGRP